MNDHQEQHGSHKRRTPEMLAVQGAGKREFASGPQNERKNIPPGSAPGLTIDLREDRRDLLKRYGLALVLAGFALFLRGVLPHPEGTALYQLPLTAVILSAWYGGRGPGLLASLICATGAGYWFVPPVNSFQIAPEHVLPFCIFIGLCLLLTEFGGARRRSARELRVSEERFRTLVQFSFDVYWETDARHRFTRQEFSEKLADAPPRSSEIGKTRWEVPYLEPDEDAWRKHRETMDAHLPFRDFELARPTADGGKRYVSVSGMPVFDEAGRFVGYRGVGRHITARKRAEAEHRAHVWFLESMDRINRAMQGTNDVEQMMSAVLDAVLEIFACDRAWLLYPCDPDVASWRVVMEHTQTQFPGAFAALERDLPMTVDSAEVARAALDFRGALPAGPGHERQVKPSVAERFGVQSEILMALHPKSDKPYLFGLHQCSRPRLWTKEEQRLFEEVGHRLTDALSSLIAFRGLRESERRLEAAQQIAHVGWWERDLVARHVSLSDECCRIFGVQPVDVPQWQPGRWLSLIHPEDQPAAAAAREAALAGGPRYDMEYRVVRPDGTVRVVHSQGDVTRDDSGRPLRQFGVIQDITELRQAEDELRATEAVLRARQELLDLAQKAAHAVAFDWYIGARESENRWSPDLEAMYGLVPGTFDGTYQSWKKLVHSDDWPAAKLAIKRAHESGDIDAEYRVIHKDDSVHWLRAKGRMFFDSQAQPERMVGFMIDVTDRRQAEEELRASEARFRTFVDRATDAFFLMDEQVRVVDVNRQACDSLGFSREELIGMHPREFDVALDEPSIQRLAQRSRAGEIITFETRHRRKDGTTFPVEVRSGTFTQGGQLFYLALVRDISERKHAEESLRQSEAYLTEAQRLSHTGSWAFDVASNSYVYTSEESDRLFGVDPQGEKPTREVIFERIHPEDRSSWKRNLEKSLREKVDTTDQYRVVLPDGTVRHIHTIRHPVVNSAGEVVKLVGTSIDITERKRAEESLRQSEAYLTEAQRLSHTGSWAFDVASNEYVYTSDESDRIYGFDPQADPPTREAIFERIHPEDRSRWKGNLEKSLREKVDTFVDYRIVLPDGRVRHLHVIRHPVLNDAGEIVRLMGTSIDITERKLAEETLREKEHALQTVRTELARVSRLTTLGEMTTSIAHEVSQPIGAMVASAGACARWLAADPPAFAEARATLDNIVADGKRAREVITRIRALTKGQTPRKELLDINHKIAEVLALMEHELRSHGIVLRTQLDKSLPRIAGDRVQLQQVILNLIVNAMEAMSGIDDRSRELTVVSGRDDTNAVVVEVRDSGSGLDAQSAERLFEAFYTTKAEGIGIGLSISRSIIEAHGGRLWASANEPHGAVFRFSLPVAQEGQS